MALSNWLSSFKRCFMTVLHATPGNTIAVPSSSTISQTSCEADFERIREEIENAGDYDLHNILRQKNMIVWCEWHLNIDGNDNAIKTAKQFHQNASKSKLSSSVADTVDTIKEMVSKLKLINDECVMVELSLKEARVNNSLLPIIKIYTMFQEFSRRLNQYLAANTYHALSLYCTILNCPTLARTQEYTETFTSVCFHPDFDKYIVRQQTVYRGIILKDKKLVENFKVGATIITTTCLSTSTNPNVADMFGDNPFEDKISVLCTYNINNTNRRTALNLRELSQKPEEDEILILPYVPFTIISLEKSDDGRTIRICFEEYTE